MIWLLGVINFHLHEQLSRDITLQGSVALSHNFYLLSHVSLCVCLCVCVCLCWGMGWLPVLNPLNPELNPICYLLALLGAHHFLHVSRIRVKLLTFRLLM